MKRKSYPTDVEPEIDPRSRSDGRRKRLKQENALLELSEQLTGLEEPDFECLGFPEGVQDAVADARLCRSGTPRNRALRRVRAELRDLETEFLDAIRRRLA